MSNINTKKNFEKLLAEKFSKSAIAIQFNLLQICPSMPSFLYAMLFIPCFNILRSYFHDSLNTVAFPTVRIAINFVTQLL